METFACVSCGNHTASVRKKDKRDVPELWSCAGCGAWGGFMNGDPFWTERPARPKETK